MDLSIIIPIFNEEDNINPLYKEISSALKKLTKKIKSYELIFINDCSEDDSLDVIKKLNDKNIKIINFKKNFGQTAALQAGFDESVGKLIITIDGDLQNDPNDMIKLFEKINSGYDLVCGWRKKRKDPFSKTFPSFFANKIIRYFTKINIHDFGCTLKIFKKSYVDKIRLFGEMHRLIPVYFDSLGARICEIEVNHRNRQNGKSKYGLNRVFKLILDLILVQFLLRYNGKSLYFFGYVAFSFLILSFICFVWMIYLKLFHELSFIYTPLPTISITLFSLSVITILLGLISELLIRIYSNITKGKTYITK